MTCQEALKIKQNWTSEQARNDMERLILTGERPADKVVGLACQALDKQIPKKPIIKYGDDTITHNLGRLMCFHCPNCGRYIVALYETDVENGAGIHNDLKGCSTCLQAIDFSGYYHISKLDEGIDFE